MAADARLRAMLREAVQAHDVNVALETGTYLGEGSSAMLADVLTAQPSPRLVTIEADWHFWRQARTNLEPYGFVECLWGRSVPIDEAISFMEEDDALHRHDQYPDVFIDDLDDPLAFYTRECRGEFVRSADSQDPAYVRDRAVHYQGDDLLRRCLEELRDDRPLILLDSAGGIGWLEFQTTRLVMGDSPYLLLLDDVHHLKHFRSLQAVRDAPDFELLGLDESAGWALARHAGVVS